MPFEEDGLFEPKLNPFDVDGVAADGDPIPTTTHGSVRTPPRLAFGVVSPKRNKRQGRSMS